MFGVQLPPLQPLHDGQVLALPLQESVPCTPCAPHHHVHNVSVYQGVIWGNLWCVSLETAPSLTYELKEELNDEIAFHRYRFEFNPIDPLKSTIKRTHSSAQRMANLDMGGCVDLVLRADQSCEDQRVALWTEGPTSRFHGTVLLSPREGFEEEVAYHDSSSKSSPLPRISGLKITPVPVVTEDIDFDRFDFVLPDFCAATGRLMVFWAGEDDYLIRLHDLL